MPGRLPEASVDSLPTCVPSSPPKTMRTGVLAANPPPLTVVELPTAPLFGEIEMLAAAKLVAAGRKRLIIVARATTARNGALMCTESLPRVRGEPYARKG